MLISNQSFIFNRLIHVFHSCWKDFHTCDHNLHSFNKSNTYPWYATKWVSCIYMNFLFQDNQTRKNHSNHSSDKNHVTKVLWVWRCTLNIIVFVYCCKSCVGSFFQANASMSECDIEGTRSNSNVIPTIFKAVNREGFINFNEYNCPCWITNNLL